MSQRGMTVNTVVEAMFLRQELERRALAEQVKPEEVAERTADAAVSIVDVAEIGHGVNNNAVDTLEG